jgi:hypothetical protein
MRFSKTIIPAKNVCSLNWCGDTLIDWVGGGAAFHLDGRQSRSLVNWAFPFDSAQSTGDGRFVVIYQRLGTKALLLREGKLLRELNRSFYHAHIYEYPICIWQNADGRPLIAHCPEKYCRIEIDDAETGNRLTSGAARKPADFFHSRLAVNCDGTRLLSAGWVWHPLDCVVTFDIAEGLRNPSHLDQGAWAPASHDVSLTEESSACWQTRERLILVHPLRKMNPLKKIPHQRTTSVYIPLELLFTTLFPNTMFSLPEELPGAMMPLGKNHVVCFFNHPKVISLDSGEITTRWKELSTGNQKSSICMDKTFIPPLAIDAKNQRFAVFGPSDITVIQIE